MQKSNTFLPEYLSVKMVLLFSLWSVTLLQHGCIDESVFHSLGVGVVL